MQDVFYDMMSGCQLKTGRETEATSEQADEPNFNTTRLGQGRTGFYQAEIRSLEFYKPLTSRHDDLRPASEQNSCIFEYYVSIVRLCSAVRTIVSLWFWPAVN
jgi:hypothetical protein